LSAFYSSVLGVSKPHFTREISKLTTKRRIFFCAGLALRSVKRRRRGRLGRDDDICQIEKFLVCTDTN